MSSTRTPPAPLGDDEIRRRLIEACRPDVGGFGWVVAFHAVGRFEALNAAAKVLHLKGGARTVSRWVASLSEQLGLILIEDADNTGVALSADGRRVWACADRLLRWFFSGGDGV